MAREDPLHGIHLEPTVFLTATQFEPYPAEYYQRGMTVILVEQNVAVSLKLADQAYVLENGRIVMQGSGQDLLHDDRVRQAYMGL